MSFVSAAEWRARATTCAELAYAFSYPGTDRKELRPEATRLFVGAPKPVVSPYESIWRAKLEGKDASLLFVNPYAQEVEAFIRSCGLSAVEGANDPLDSVVTELELLQFLAMVASEEIDGASSVPMRFPGGSAQNAYARFWEEHARVWLPAFARNVIEKTEEDYYRAHALELLRFFEQC